MDLRFSTRSFWFVAPLVAAGALVMGIVPLRPQPGAGASVVRRTVDEMPLLDVGVQQVVHATFVGERNPAVGAPANLTLVVTSGAADVSVRAEILPPSAATLQKGAGAWEGTLSRLEEAGIPVSVLLPGDRGGFVRAEITARLPDGREIRSATAIYVDPGAPDNPAPEARTLIEADGRTLDVVVNRPNGR